MQLPEPVLKLTLEKPAIVEEIEYEEPKSESSHESRRSDTSKPSGESRSSSESESSGGKGKLLGLLVLAGVGLLVWKRKGSESTEQAEVDEFGESKYEHGPEPEIGGEEGGVKRKVAGVLGLAVVTLAVAVLKRRG